MEHRRQSKARRKIQLYSRIGLCALIVLLVVLVGIKLWNKSPFNKSYMALTGKQVDAYKPQIDVRFLTKNKYSRPGKKVSRIRNIVIHYTANPGSTAIQNRNYFEGLKDSKKTSASSHFIVGLEGEIIQCIPLDEISYASNHRNSDTISIETCHVTQDGSYTEDTYQSMIDLTVWLCKKFDLTEDDIIRHYDITEKICPKYFVENEDAWETFKKQVGSALD